MMDEIQQKDDLDVKKTAESTLTEEIKLGSFTGFLIKIGFGFLLYYGLLSMNNQSNFFSYNDVVSKVNDSYFYKFIYFVMTFSEGEFYGSIFATVGVIAGGALAWNLYKNQSRWAGTPISAGSNMWPWILASQLLSLFFTIFVFNFTSFFSPDMMWLPNFIVVVGTPPSLIMIYGPGWKKLVTISFLGALLSFPLAFWMNNFIMPHLAIPGMVSNVATMAIVGVIISAICLVLPWMKRTQAPYIHQREEEELQRLRHMDSPIWSIKRTLADFSEAWFYGNEWVGAFVIVGAVIDWLLNSRHITNGSGLFPDILFGQIIASSIGVYLYSNRFKKEGWYPTFMPLVSTVPGLILMFGGGLVTVFTAGILGGVLSAPLGHYFYSKLPDYIPAAVGCVAAMTVITAVCAAVLQAFPYFIQ